jgi:hypothetical protein
MKGKSPARDATPVLIAILFKSKSEVVAGSARRHGYMQGSGRIAPHILNPDTRRKWAVSYKLRPLYSLENNPNIRCMGGPQIRSGHKGRQKNFRPCRKSKPSPPARRLITKHTELPRLLRLNSSEAAVTAQVQLYPTIYQGKKMRYDTTRIHRLIIVIKIWKLLRFIAPHYTPFRLLELQSESIHLSQRNIL